MAGEPPVLVPVLVHRLQVGHQPLGLERGDAGDPARSARALVRDRDPHRREAVPAFCRAMFPAASSHHFDEDVTRRRSAARRSPSSRARSGSAEELEERVVRGGALPVRPEVVELAGLVDVRLATTWNAVSRFPLIARGAGRCTGKTVIADGDLVGDAVRGDVDGRRVAARLCVVRDDDLEVDRLVLLLRRLRLARSTASARRAPCGRRTDEVAEIEGGLERAELVAVDRRRHLRPWMPLSTIQAPSRSPRAAFSVMVAELPCGSAPSPGIVCDEG